MKSFRVPARDLTSGGCQYPQYAPCLDVRLDNAGNQRNSYLSLDNGIAWIRVDLKLTQTVLKIGMQGISWGALMVACGHS